MDMPDVETLARSEDEEEVDEDEEEDEEEEEAEDSQKSKVPKLLTDHERSSVTSRFVRSMEVKHSKMMSECQTLIDTTWTQTTIAEKSANAAKMISEIAVVKRRVTCLKSVLEGSPDKLSDMIKEVNDHKSSAASSQSQKNRDSDLAKAPPSALYNELKTFKSIADKATEFETLDTKDAMETLKKDINKMYKPITDLIGSVKSAVVELKRAKKDRETEKEFASGTSLVGQTAKKEKIAKGCNTVMDIIAKISGHDMEVHDLETDAALDNTWRFCGRPMLFKLKEATFQTLKDAGVQNFLGEFVKVLVGQTDGARTDQRGGAPIPADSPAVEIVEKVFDGVLPPTFCVPLADVRKFPQLAPNFNFSAFGICEKYCHPSSLKDGLASMWLCYAGERHMLIVKHDALLASYLVATAASSGSPAPSPAPKLAKIVSYLQSITEDEVQKLFAAKAAWQTTLAAGHVIYVPAGYVMMERVVGGMCYGFSARVLVKEDKEGIKYLRNCSDNATSVAAADLMEGKAVQAPVATPVRAAAKSTASSESAKDGEGKADQGKKRGKGGNGKRVDQPPKRAKGKGKGKKETL